MSLYNNVADKLTSQGLIGGLQSGISSAIESTAGKAIEKFGGGKLATAAVNAGAGLASNTAAQLVNKYVPASLRAKIDSGSRVLGHAMNGDWESAGLESLEGGLFDGLLGTLSGSAKQQRIMGAKSPMLGGGNLQNARQIMERVVMGGHVRKNLFLLEVSSLSEGDFSSTFNLFAVDVSYDAFNLTGEKLRVGGAVLDKVVGQEAVEMRLNTFDNQAGDLKRFWARHHAKAVARDGTVGVPADYGIRIKILHGVTEGGDGHSGAYADEGFFRVQTLPVELSRRENGLQEMQLTLSQLDTFMKV